jgi:Mrp family chromosome partitioning ATPase
MVYLTKFGHTEKSLLEIPANLLKSGKVNHIGVIFNGIGEKSGYKYEYSYNYGYGYGYGVSEQK